MQARAFSVGELDALSLVPGIDYNDPSRVPFFFNPQHELFQACAFPEAVVTLLAQHKQDGKDVSGVPVFKLCRDAEKQGLEGRYFQINDFKLNPKSKKPSWESSVTHNKNASKRLSKQAMLTLNKPIIRMYMMGCPHMPVVCPIDNILIDNTSLWGVPMNNWQGHHIVVVNGESLHKLAKDRDPGVLLSTMNLTECTSATLRAIQEITKTVFLTPGAHERVHKATNAQPGRNSDITNYERHQLPWALRSENNWNDWRQFLLGYGYPLLPSHEEHMQELTLPHA
jgi:hypothetical protein